MNNIDEYLAGLPIVQRKELERIRSVVVQTLPEAKETFSYGMPVFKYKTKYLVGFAAFKNHMSIFPGPEVIYILKDKLQKFKISKGTVQFSLDNNIGDELIREIIRQCVSRIDRLDRN